MTECIYVQQHADVRAYLRSGRRYSVHVRACTAAYDIIYTTAASTSISKSTISIPTTPHEHKQEVSHNSNRGQSILGFFSSQNQECFSLVFRYSGCDAQQQQEEQYFDISYINIYIYISTFI